MLTRADIQFIVDNEKGDVSRLLLGKAPQGVNLQLCCKCIQAREKMRVKSPLWYANPSLVYPFSVSVEQGSSQTTALFKQKIIAGLYKDVAKLLSFQSHCPPRQGYILEVSEDKIITSIDENSTIDYIVKDNSKVFILHDIWKNPFLIYYSCYL